MKIQRAWKFKLELNKRQTETLSIWLSHLRCLYNLALEQRILCYTNFKNHGSQISKNQSKKTINYYDQANELSSLKKEFPFFKEVPSQLLQQKLKDVDSAYQKFFKSGAGFPKFKKKRDPMGMRFPDPKQFSIEKRKGKRTSIITLPKIGSLKLVYSRDIVGQIKNCTISRQADGFYISFQSEYEINPLANTNESLGIDRGVRSLGMSSSGESFNLPIEKIKKIEIQQIRLQKKLSRKKKGSQNFKKTVQKMNRIYKQITDTKQDSLHKITNQITKNHGMIVIEDLKVKSMTSRSSVRIKQKSGLNRAILRSSWGEFARQLEYKSIWNGGILVKVKPQFTSQKCNSCGYTEKNNRDNIKFCCMSCGHQDHADINAAKNILAAGHAVTVCGDSSFGVLAKTKTRYGLKKQKPIKAQVSGILGVYA